jgi:3-oxoacyl-[acyl-carrier-protein] synthase-1
VGGVDSLCQTTLYGFNALGLVSAQPCRPWDKERDGINIGEAVGLVLLEPVSPGETGGIVLVGYGESNDAYHISSPHPEGKGAALAMQRALASANVRPTEVDYINLHGTASRANDLAEDYGVVSVFGTHTPCSSTKGWTGHTLGAAGITEAIFVTLCLTHQFLPGTLHTQVIDPQLSAQVLLKTEERRLRYVLTNSFGFGGSNCSLLFGKGL